MNINEQENVSCKKIEIATYTEEAPIGEWWQSIGSVTLPADIYKQITDMVDSNVRCGLTLRPLFNQRGEYNHRFTIEIFKTIPVSHGGNKTSI